jgi:rfaE bifunctional protein nucleotidyltransferase chain/domain
MLALNPIQTLEDKLCASWASAKAAIDQAKAEGKRVVFTNGVFDLLHRGHVTYLAHAAGLGDLLVVGVNSDESVKRLKGPTRPLQTLEDRMWVLAGLESVGLVVAFEEDTPADLIAYLNPDVLVKGADYTVENIAGASHVLKNGGQVLTIDLVEGKSTTAIIQKMGANLNLD